MGARDLTGEIWDHISSKEFDVCEDPRMVQKLSVNQRKTIKIVDYDDKSDAELIRAISNHFRDIGKSYAQGFHLLDKSDDKMIGTVEISNGLKEAGFAVSLGRAQKLTQSFASRGGKMDKAGFLRFMASASLKE